MQSKTFFLVVLIVSTFLISLFQIQSAQATNGMKLIGLGPVQRSMGGVSIALPLDSATLMTNPAGITTFTRRLDFGVSMFAPSMKYKATAVPMTGAVTSDDTWLGSSKAISPIPAFGLILPINDDFTFGIGAYGTSGMGVDYSTNLYNNVTYSKFTFMKFAPTIAYKINKMIRVGVAFNMDYATMDFNAGSPPTAPAAFFPQQAHQGGSAFGFGATIGVLVIINDMLSTGIAYESKQIFPDYKFNTLLGEDKLDFDQPQNVAWGFAVKPFETLRGGFDFVWIHWPQTNGANKPNYTTNNSGAAPWNLNWGHQLVYKFGVEWDALEILSVRFGYNYGKNPLDNTRAFEGIAFPAIAEHHITFGSGIKISKSVIANVGVVYSPTKTFYLANPTEQFINSAQVKMWQISGEMGISWLF